MAETATFPSPLPGPTAGIETNVSVNVLSRMPGIHGKNSLCFHGKNMLEFLMEYECAAKHANLMNEKKCQELRIYFTKKEKCILCQGASKTGSICDVRAPAELRRIYEGSLKGNGSLLNA